MQKAGNGIVRVILAVGAVISVVMLVVLGIKYMMANSEDKAILKETLTPYIISCCVIFGAFAIWKLVINILQ